MSDHHRGVDQWCAKLNDAIVREIREFPEDETNAAIRVAVADNHGVLVSEVAIFKARKRQTWRHVL